MIDKYLQRPLLLRLLLPLATGILCADWYFFSHRSLFPSDSASGCFQFLSTSSAWIYAILLFSLFLIYVLSRYNRFHWSEGIAICLFFFGFGIIITTELLHETDFPFSGKAGTYEVVICTNPQPTMRSIACQAVLTEELQHGKLKRFREKYTFLLYFPKDSVDARLRQKERQGGFTGMQRPDSVATTLHRGDRLLLYSHLSPPANNGNPDEFDNVHYQICKGISGSAYITGGHWRVIGHESSHTLRQQALDLRDRIERLYQRLGFRDDRLTVLSALTLGDKEELSHEIKETYSIAGASHILALSGLHIGFLYGLFLFLLRPLWEWKAPFKFVAGCFIIILLWGFAFFTGFTPSVVRSVIMFSLLTIARVLRNEQLSLNTLSATALLMLVCNPLWLFDVGFQLSFSAVASILLLQPRFYHLITVKGRIFRSAWGLLTLTVAAQIGTLPLVLYYFSRFPVHFMLTNLWVTFMTSLILYGALLLLLLTPFPFLQFALAKVVDLLIGVQNGLLACIKELPFASVNDLFVDKWEVILLYSVFLLLVWYFSRPVFRRAFIVLSSILVLVSYHFMLSIYCKPCRSLAFYNLRDCPAVHCLTTTGQSWLACADTTPRLAHMQRALSRYWNRMHLSAPQIISRDYSSPMLSFHHHLLTYAGKTICLLNDNSWGGKMSLHPLTVDYLYISKGYKGYLSDLQSLFSIRTVILDGSLSTYSAKRIGMECLRLGIPYVVLTEHGALSIPL